MKIDGIDRWQSAQKVEKEHRDDVGHQLWGIETGAKYFDRFFDVGLEFFEEKRVLAVGAGTGFIHNFDFNCRNVGIDPLMDQYETVPEQSSADVLTSVGEALPFRNGEFDVVFSFNVIDHTADPDQVIREVHRVLTDDGVFLLNSNVFELPEFIRHRLHYIDRPHPYHFSPASLRNRVENAGFAVENENLKPYRREKANSNLKTKVATTAFRMKRWSCHAYPAKQ